MEAYLKSLSLCMNKHASCLPDMNGLDRKYFQDNCETRKVLAPETYNCVVTGTGEKNTEEESKIFWGDSVHFYKGYESYIEAYNSCKNNGYRCAPTPSSVDREAAILSPNLNIHAQREVYLNRTLRCLETRYFDRGGYHHCWIIGKKKL